MYSHALAWMSDLIQFIKLDHASHLCCLKQQNISDGRKKKSLPTWRWLFSGTVICQCRPDTINLGKLNGHSKHTLPVRAMASSCAGRLHRLLRPIITQTPPVMFMSSLPPLWIIHEGSALEESGPIQHFNLKMETLSTVLSAEAADTLVKLTQQTEFPNIQQKSLCVHWEIHQLSK